MVLINVKGIKECRAQGPELQSLGRLKLSIDISGCENNVSN